MQKRTGEKLGQELKNWRKKKDSKKQSQNPLHWTKAHTYFIKLAINSSLISLTLMLLYYIVIISFPLGSLLSSKNTKGHF